MAPGARAGPARPRQRLAVALQILGQDHELVAAHTGDGVAVAHHLGQPLGDGDQQVIAQGVTKAVVDRLEAIEVYEQHRHQSAAAVQACERLPGTVHQQQTIGELGKRVVQRLALQPDAVADILGGGVPGASVAARAPQQPAPRAVAVTVAIGEVGDLGAVVASGEQHRGGLLDIVGVHELAQRSSQQILA